MAKKKRPPTTDEVCEEAITSTAVEAREWAASHPEDGFAQTYLKDYAEPFYEAGAIRCWFDDFEEVEEGITTFQQMIIRLPDDPDARRRVVELFEERQAGEDSVDDPSEYIGERFCLFSFYL